jgi:hypothetical protein
MKIEKFYCDRTGCKNERIGEANLTAYLESTRDASGNGSDHWYACFDLCPKHALDLLQTLLTSLFDSNEPITKSAKALLDTQGIKWEAK